MGVGRVFWLIGSGSLAGSCPVCPLGPSCPSCPLCPAGPAAPFGPAASSCPSPPSGGFGMPGACSCSSTPMRAWVAGLAMVSAAGSRGSCRAGQPGMAWASAGGRVRTSTPPRTPAERGGDACARPLSVAPFGAFGSCGLGRLGGRSSSQCQPAQGGQVSDRGSRSCSMAPDGGDASPNARRNSPLMPSTRPEGATAQRPVPAWSCSRRIMCFPRP